MRLRRTTPHRCLSIIATALHQQNLRYTIFAMASIAQKELWQAQLALIVATFLQVILNSSLVVGPKYAVALLELGLVAAIGITGKRRDKNFRLHRTFSLVLIALISVANIASLALVCNALIHGNSVPGKELILAAIAIFFTNIIIFAIWYWEFDSPGLSGIILKSKQNFQFASKALGEHWQPTFPDYLYLSLTNATAFSPTDTMPLSHAAKGLMGIQSLVSLLTLALVAARAINILA